MERANAIIQARLGSTRLPNKVLKDLCGKTILQHIVERISRARLVNNIIIATTTNPLDDLLETYINDHLKLPVYRGSENNVLERYIMASRLFPSDIIVRITADDPLKDPEIIDQCIHELKINPQLDYCSNTIKPTFPEGLDIEAFRSRALEKAYSEATLPSEKEHVTPYIWKRPELYNIKNVYFSEDLSSWRWTVDKPRDFELMEYIFKYFKESDNNFSYKDVIAFVKNNPKLIAYNQDTIRNEGYFKSLQGEQNA